MRTTLLVLLGALALAGCQRTNATPTSTTRTRSADLDQASKTQAMPAPTAVETPDQAAVRDRAPNENIRSEAGRSVDAAHAILPRGEDRMSNVGRSSLTDADSGAP
ncbi:MAG TPA: hypothetical protein VIF62_17215 [Labilithrix sp.]|jgi:hypothetical protein